MDQEIDLKEMDTKIQLLKKTTEELKQTADKFPALYTNTSRILASIRVLEINVSDVLRLKTTLSL